MDAIVESRVEFDQAISLYDPAKHLPLAMHFGQDVRVAALTFRSWALWLLGYCEAALADAEHAFKDAREIGQATTLMYGLVHAPFTYLQCGSYATAKSDIDELVALADEKGSLSWRGLGMTFQGWLLSPTGKASDAVRMLHPDSPHGGQQDQQCVRRCA
jgi:hypothetical protein